MGTLYRRNGSCKWMMAVVIAGKQVCRSSTLRINDELFSFSISGKQKCLKAAFTFAVDENGF